jgi:hypothetical protein
MGARGQAMVEYLVAAAIVLALVSLPIGGGNSAIVTLLKAVRLAFHKFLSAASLPQ